MSRNWLSFQLMLALSLNCVLASEMPCPKVCDCISPPNISVICTSSELSTFPDSFPSSSVSISVEFTNITSLLPQSLSAVPLLEELHLSNNALKSLPDRLLTPMYRLHTLDLTNNLLRSLNHTLFLDMPHLRSLVLSGNLLTELWSTNARILWTLQRLDISSNRLRTLQPHTFSSLHFLKSIDLSYNDLYKVPSSLLSNMIILQRLNLEGNKLLSLPPKFFANNYFLQHVFLARNNLHSLPAGLLRPLALLRILDLSDNMLHTLPPNLLQDMWKVTIKGEQVLDVSNNPWHCDCHLQSMHSWLRAYTNLMYNMYNTMCAGPEALKGRTLVHVQEEDLLMNCPETRKKQ